MRNICLFLISALLMGMPATAQKYLTKTGHIKFYSEAPLEKIEAHNRQVNSALDASTGDFVFKVLMKSFEFEKALMQEHFNENYVESDKYPDATFLGKVTNIKEVNFGKDGSYEVQVEGKLKIHGVLNTVKASGTFEVKKDRVAGKAKFNLTLADYKITVPATVGKNISSVVEITVEVNLDKANL